MKLKLDSSRKYSANPLVDSQGNSILYSTKNKQLGEFELSHIAHCVNNYPTTIRFLKEAVKYMYPTGVKNEINEFLTKIENNETTT